MTSAGTYEDLYVKIAKLRQRLTSSLAPHLINNPQLAELITKRIDDQVAALVAEDRQGPPPQDLGFAELMGIGPDASDDLRGTRIPLEVEVYDEEVAAERIIAIGDLYYQYQHEKTGVFKAVTKLQELFRAGTLKLSGGPGAFGLYRFDKRGVLRYTKRDRLAAYRRAFGYGNAQMAPGASPNAEFHRLFSHFMHQVADFWRDKRVSDVIRERAFDPSFGSMAMVRRAGLDLRNNLKVASYGHLNVLRVEVMQTLDEALRILGSEDVKQQFGASNAWDVVEEVMKRYFNANVPTSPRQRMAIAGREVLRWLAQDDILQTTRIQLEVSLNQIADETEEWITSAAALGVIPKRSPARTRSTLPFERRVVVGANGKG